MASQIYNSYKQNALKGAIAPLTDTFKVALLKSGYTPDIDAHAFFSDVSAQESSGTNYTAGGLIATSKAITQDNANDRAILDFDDAVWANVSFADARWAVIYKSTGVAATSPLVAVLDLGATQTAAADTFTIQFSALGVYYLG